MHVETDLGPPGIQVYPCLEKRGGGGGGRGGCHHMSVINAYLAWN